MRVRRIVNFMKKSICISLSAACMLGGLASGSIAYSASAYLESGPNEFLTDTSGDTVYWSQVEPPSNETAARVVQKQEVAKALIFGETTFAEAANRLRELGRNEVPECLRQLHPGATDAEIWYHQVIAFVKGLGCNYPNRVAAIVPTLESDVAQRFGRAPGYAFAPSHAVKPIPGGQFGSPAPRAE
jgi:hypothetical protein